MSSIFFFLSSKGNIILFHLNESPDGLALLWRDANNCKPQYVTNLEHAGETLFVHILTEGGGGPAIVDVHFWYHLAHDFLTVSWNILKFASKKLNQWSLNLLKFESYTWFRADNFHSPFILPNYLHIYWQNLTLVGTIWLLRQYYFYMYPRITWRIRKFLSAENVECINQEIVQNVQISLNKNHFFFHM